jgi:hypothetical protein
MSWLAAALAKPEASDTSGLYRLAGLRHILVFARDVTDNRRQRALSTAVRWVAKRAATIATTTARTYTKVAIVTSTYGNTRVKRLYSTVGRLLIQTEVVEICEGLETEVRALTLKRLV